MLQATGYPAEIADFYSTISAGYWGGFLFAIKDRAAHYDIWPVSQNLSWVYFLLPKFQLVSYNFSLAMVWQMTYTHKLKKLCSATLK